MDSEINDLVPNGLEIMCKTEIIESNCDIVDEQMNIEPVIGIEFESFEKVKKFFKAFAMKKGFGIQINSSKQKSYILYVVVKDNTN